MDARTRAGSDVCTQSGIPSMSPHVRIAYKYKQPFLTTVVGQVSSAPYRLRHNRLEYGWWAISRKHGNGNEAGARRESAPPVGTQYQSVRTDISSYSLPPSAAERDSQPAGVNAPKAPSPRKSTDMGPAVWLANSLEGV